MNTMISLIAALTINHVIGRENTIPWYFFDDMIWFKYHTWNKPVIMGRKTFNSINNKPLSDRFNIILSHKLFINECDNIFVVKTPMQALSLVTGVKEVMIIGGSSIYKIFLPACKRMYLTYIGTPYSYGDSWFPNYNRTKWKLIFNIYKLCLINKGYFYRLNFLIFDRK